MKSTLTLPASVSICSERSSNWDITVLRCTKRAFDIIISSLLLVLLAPLLVGLAVGVKLSSRGPALYKWKVVGLGGRPFTGYKFRSMHSDADLKKRQLESLNEMQGPVFKLRNDPRITTFGAWLRRYSLDELPQLYNVLKGDMSLVGPRPPLVTEYQRFTDFHKLKLMVKPGITCLWQVNGRNSISNFDDWVRLDLEYIHTWSLRLDFRILLKTFAVVLAGTGR